MAGQHGGRRKGAGRRRGSKNKSTLERLINDRLPEGSVEVLDLDQARKLAAHHVGHLLQTLRDIAEDPKCPAHARVGAFRELREFGYGKSGVMQPDKPPAAPEAVRSVPVLPPGCTVPLDYPHLLAKTPEEANAIYAAHQRGEADPDPTPEEAVEVSVASTGGKPWEAAA